VSTLIVFCGSVHSLHAGAVLRLGDILLAEPSSSSISVYRPSTGTKTLISQGGLLAPANKTVGVALARDGDIIVVQRAVGLIRINPVTGAQSVLSDGGFFSDPWALVVDEETGDIYVADSGYDNDRPEINGPGKIIRVNPATGVQELIASGTSCTAFPVNKACLNTTLAGAYIAHPYGIAIDYTTNPSTLVVADMSSFDGRGAIYRLEPLPGGAQTLLWGPASAVPAPQVPQAFPLECPMGIAVEPNGNLLTTVFTFPVPAAPMVPPPAGTFYGCASPGIFRVDLANNVQRIVNANAPAWQPNRSYMVGEVIRHTTSVSTSHVHQVVTAGVSQGTAPAWNTTSGGVTADGSVIWQNAAPGGNWLIPFGLDTEPSPTPGDPLRYNVIVGDEGYSMLFRLSASGDYIPAPGPLLTGTPSITSLDVITFTPVGGFKTEPFRLNGQPTGTLATGTTQITLTLETSENATCRYGTTAGVPYGLLTASFTSTGSTSHATLVTGLSNGNGYDYYVRCVDEAENVNTDDFIISFAIPHPPFSGPVAAYNFDQGSGSILADLSGNGHNGAISGATWNLSGRHGRALNFDGINDWVTVQPTSLLNLIDGMTVEAWVFPTNANGVRDIVIKEGASDHYNLYSRNAQGRVETNVLVGGSNQTASAFALVANTWTHVAGTYDGTVLRLFINGVEMATRTSVGSIATSSGPLRIGGNSLWGEFFRGRLDDLRIYNRALSPSEILTDMDTPVGGTYQDTTAPFRSSGAPSGAQPWGTTQVTLQVSTSENATCRYSTVAGTAYSAMTTTFATTGSTAHSNAVTGLTTGSYTFYVRCTDSVGNINTSDFPISFSVAGAVSVSSTFGGTPQNPLVENGRWDSPGSWADMQKSAGAFATGLNALARLATPTMPGDQYSEITYDRDPGAFSWVGVATRVQGPGNGSGYLAIVYAGEIRLYRADDTGSLTFTQLASVSVNITVAPRRLRMESQGNNHRIYFNGNQVLSHTASGTVYMTGQPGIAASVFGGPQAKILSFVAGNISVAASDITPPYRFGGEPTGVLPWGSTEATLHLTTGEPAVCRYSLLAGVPFESMSDTFTTTGSTTHKTVVNGLENDAVYNFRVRCVDSSSNSNTDDFVIGFSVAGPFTISSQFIGQEMPLSENGTWDSPGAWADLQKNNGAFAPGLNALGRLVISAITPQQYSQITYEQDPGTLGWVGVAARIQGASSGSCYLAIVFAGEVRLYRTEDSGSLNFTQLAGAAVEAGAGPRQLRLEAENNELRVYFNGTEVINHTAFGTVYTIGQPGIAASVFGGPQVRILSFAAGDLQ
jgi:hypothetical protein